jgi:hypothetical protein
MRTAVIVLCALAAFASGSYMTSEVKYPEKGFLEKESFVLEILQHIHQDDVFIHKYEAGRDYHFEQNYDHFYDVEFVKHFYDIWEHHHIHDDEIFSVFDEDHVELARYLSGVFTYAKDWETFKSVALWARFHVNKQLFVYAFTVAVTHRPDMVGIVLPAVYEIYPYYFFNSETIQKAQFYKMHGFHTIKKVEDVYQLVIQSNYTGKWGHFNDENVLSYFTEDVGLNQFYYYYNLDYPYWTKGLKETPLKNDHRGAFYFFLHWQLLARYYMERLSHNLGEVQTFNYYEKLDTGYHTGLRYYNGVFFPNRDDFHHLYYEDNYYLAHRASAYEQRFYDVIDTHRVFKHDHTYYEMKFDTFEHEMDSYDMFGNLMQGTKDSVYEKYYGDYDRVLRTLINDGIPFGKHGNVLPGALMHYETSLRDPAFYSMYKHVMQFYWDFVEHLDSYTEKELGFDGVKIETVDVEKLVTYFDVFDADITNAVDVEIYDEKKATDFVKFGRVSEFDGHDFYVKARQYRLNHLPFKTKLTVTSDKAQKAVVKFFLGPKYDHLGHEIHLEDNFQNFIELEHFKVDLVAGKNVITRDSNDFSWYVNDRTTYFELYKNLMLATNGDSHKFPLDMSEAHCGFPKRLILPRGKKGGMPFQFYFIVLPYHEPKVEQFHGFDQTLSCGVGSGARYVDELPYGFPFNRHVDTKYFDLENMYFFDTMIYHKTEADVNAVH